MSELEIKEFPAIDKQLSGDGLEWYKLPESMKNPFGKEPFYAFRPDRGLVVEKTKDGLEKVTGIVGNLVVGKTTVVYDRSGKILRNVAPKDRIGFQAAHFYGSGARGTGLDEGVAIVGEKLPQYLT